MLDIPLIPILQCTACRAPLRMAGVDRTDAALEVVFSYTCCRDCTPLEPEFDEAVVEAAPAFPLPLPDRHLHVISRGLFPDSRRLTLLYLPQHITAALTRAGFKTLGDVITEINAGRFHLYPNVGPVALDLAMRSLKEVGYDVEASAYEY